MLLCNSHTHHYTALKSPFFPLNRESVVVIVLQKISQFQSITVHILHYYPFGDVNRVVLVPKSNQYTLTTSTIVHKSQYIIICNTFLSAGFILHM